jgi:hypothetical protein
LTQRSEAYYRGLVESALRDAGVTEPPVSIAGVAQHLGVPVRVFLLPPWFTGALIYEDGLPAVLLNGSRPEATQRLALAHILGHVLVLLGDATASYPRDQLPEHREADLMAEEFEMPGYLVRNEAQKWFNDYRYLSGLFGVTESQMFERMQQLGIIKSRGVVWDY